MIDAKSSLARGVERTKANNERVRRPVTALFQRRQLTPLLLIACALLPDAPVAWADDAAPSLSQRALHMFGLGGAPKPDNAAAKDGALKTCPEIVVDGGSAELRAPPGAEASSVRYQIALGRMARECTRKGDEISVKVGIEGAVVLGPAGQPGAYSGNLRIALRRKRDEQLFGAKNYRVGATLPAGAARNEFSLLVENLDAPLISVNTNDDYEIIVGLTQENAAPVAKKRHKGG
jgi:hypothetical protein